MKILEVILSLDSGGAERFVVDLSNSLVELGHQVKLLSIKDFEYGNHGFYRKEVDSKVEVFSLEYKDMSVSSFFKTWNFIKKQNVDIVHLHLPSTTFFCALPILFHGKTSYVVTSHNQAEFEKDRFFQFVVKKILFKLNRFAIVAISHQNYKSNLMVYGKPIDIIYNGRSSIQTTIDFTSVENEISTYKETRDTQVFVFVARCSPQKNVMRLVRCFNKVKEMGIDIVLLIIGNGYDSSIGKEAMKSANAHIKFLGAKHNVADYMINSDFFTLSSDYEGMPITLIEALSVGCIPVSTPVSGINDLIKDGINGFVSKDFTDNSYVDCIIRAVRNKKLIKKDLLIKYYNDNLSMDSCSKKYESLFRKLENKHL